MNATQAPPGSTGREQVVARLIEQAAIAVIRLNRATPDEAMRAVAAIHAGGVSAVEVTMTMPGALDLISRLSREMGDELLVGVGSVLDADTARRSVEAGARYVVSPVFRQAIVDETHRQGAAALPAGFTPTEILTAHEAGADIVKITPAEVLGPAFIKGVLAPMPFLRIMPTGGVTPENAGDWLRAGAVAVGLGSALVDPKLVAAGDFAALTTRARTLVATVAEARGGSR
jgi:2-dehydro-3-deoxyphosphogluconate aldolase/(4S)-4-hydroxy-2-oxoglutarate aldolase